MSGAISSNFNTNQLPRDDDSASSAIPLGFSANFFGHTYSNVFISNNGYLTFNTGQTAFTPTGLGASYSGQPIIAPFFADVDTRNPASGVTSYGSGTYAGHIAFGATWPNVGYYNQHADKLDTFQAILVDRSDTGAGNFDIYFNYGPIRWETGDANSGRNGLGGTSASAGYNAGTGNAQGTYYQLLGSLAPGSFLDSGPDALASHTNDGVAGQYLFPVRNGQIVLRDIGLHGPHTDYIVAVNPAGGAVVQDRVAGRDGTQTPSTLHNLFFSDGVGRFDATGNAEEAARLYKAALNRAPDASGLDYWTAQLDGNSLGLVGMANAFIASPEFNARYGALDTTSFVQQLYQNVLGRAGDSGGVQYWTGQINGGTSRAQVLADFSDSVENKSNTSATIGDRDRGEAYRLYQAAFNRTPDTGGLNYWTTQLEQGSTPSQVAQSFVNSAEFAQAFTGQDPTSYVNQLYQNVLHRAGDASGVQYWAGQLQGGQSRAQVLQGFSDSLENRLATAGATHDGWVFLG